MHRGLAIPRATISAPPDSTTPAGHRLAIEIAKTPLTRCHRRCTPSLASAHVQKLIENPTLVPGGISPTRRATRRGRHRHQQVARSVPVPFFNHICVAVSAQSNTHVIFQSLRRPRWAMTLEMKRCKKRKRQYTWDDACTGDKDQFWIYADARSFALLPGARTFPARAGRHPGSDHKPQHGHQAGVRW